MGKVQFKVRKIPIRHSTGYEILVIILYVTKMIFYLYLIEIVQIIASRRWKEFTRLKKKKTVGKKCTAHPKKLYTFSLSTFTDNLYIYINEHDTSVLASPSLSVDVSLLALPVPCVSIQFEYQTLCLISSLYYCLRKTASDS